MSGHPVASTSTAPAEGRFPPSRFAPPASQAMPWADTIKPATVSSFRPGHSPSASAPSMSLSTPSSSSMVQGIPIIPSPGGARRVRTPLDGSLPHSPSAGPSRLSGPRVADVTIPEERFDVPPTPPAKPFAANLAIRTRSPQRQSPRSSPQGHPGNLPSTPSSPTTGSHHLPPTALVSPPPPAFKPIILSPVPLHAKDVAQIIVKLETDKTTFKTTFQTLTSRPSLLSSMLHELVAPIQAGDEPSSPDATSPLGSLFRDRIPSNGPLHQAEGVSMIHIFLDRPSDPYEHILAHLRAPGSHLPHAVKLSGRIEELIALRDEARYLELNELAQLCAEELLGRRIVRGRTGGIAQVAPLIAPRSKSQSPPMPPAPIVTQLPPNHVPHAVQIVHQDDEQLRSSVARRGFI